MTTPATTPPERAPWRILVVDDEESLNWSLVTSLRRDGYDADGAATGEQARDRLTQATYDCVISDVKMPGMDGFELLQWLRQHRPGTRVIMMTAFGSPSARQEALRDGAIAYIEKPFDLRELKDALHRLTTESAASAASAANAANAGPPEPTQRTERAEGDGYDLLEIARVISLSRRDIAVSVQGGGYTGILRFLRGDLVWAEAGPLRGEAAFLALCTPREGQIQPLPWDGRTERNVTAPVSRLIYHALSAREGRPIGASGALVLDPTSEAQSATPPTPPDPPAPARSEPATTTASPPVDPSYASRRITSSPTLGEDELRESVRTIARSLPDPCGVVLLRSDGVILAQSWSGMREVTASAFSHLAAAAQAASRALLLANLGSLGDVRVHAEEHALVLRRAGGSSGPLILIAVVPAGSDLDAVAAALALPRPDGPRSSPR